MTDDELERLDAVVSQALIAVSNEIDEHDESLRGLADAADVDTATRLVADLLSRLNRGEIWLP